MAIAYAGTGGAAGATITISGTETLATLKTSLAANTTYGTISNNVITFAATLVISSTGSGGAATFTASDCVLYFPSTYTFQVPNATGQTGTITNLTDVEIIFDGSAKSYYNAINYGVHNWTRVVYRNQGPGRTDLFTNNGETFNFNNVQLVVSGNGDFIHLYGAASVTYTGITVVGLGTTESFEVGANGGTTSTMQTLTLSGTGITILTINNGTAAYNGIVDYRSLSWASATNWAANLGTGVGTVYFTNPNKPGGWTGYTITVLYTGGAYTFAERYTHDVTAINSSATGVSGVSVGDYRSGAFLWTTTTNSSGVITEQYVTTVSGTGTSTANNYAVPLTTYSTTVQIAAWLYGYVTVVGSRTFTPAGSGITDTLLMAADQTTLSQSAAAALTSIATLDNLYDASRNWNTLNSTNIQIPALGTNIITYAGSQLNLGSYNLVMQTTGSAFSVAGTTITINTTTLAVGTKFTSFTTTGTVTVGTGVTVTAPFSTSNTVTNNGTINAQYTSSAGTSGVLTLTNLVSGSTIYVANNSGVQQTYLASSGTSQTFYYAPNAASTWTWKVAKYGYFPLTGSFTSNTISSQTVAQNSDTGITTSNVITVSGYTSLNSPDQVYDYAAYWETTSVGISITRVTTQIGSYLSFGSASVTFNTSAGNVYVATGTTATIKSASSFGPGVNSTYFVTSSTVTLTGVTYGTTFTCAYTSTAGSSTVLTLTGLAAGSSVSIANNSGSQQQYIASASSPQAIYIAPQASANWTWKVSNYGYLSATGSFTTSLYQSAIVTLANDTGITQSNKATVAAYTSFSIPDQMYDYLAYWETTNNTGGIQVTRPASKNGTQVSFGSNNLVFSTSAGSAYAYTAGSPNTLTFKTASTFNAGTTFASIATSGTLTLTGVTMACIYTTGSGTSSNLQLVGLPAGSSVYVQNATGTQQLYATGQSGTYNYVLGPGASSGTWKWAAKSLGYSSAAGSYTPSSGGLTSISVNMPQKLQPSGGVMYTGSTNSLCSISFNGTTEADILIGNGSVTVQNVFDISENALVNTAAGMAWLASGLGELSEYLAPTGNFLFMTTKWRLEALNTNCPNASLLGFPLSTDGTPINSTNGTIIIFSSSQASDIATAVWNALVASYNTSGTMGALLNSAEVAAALAAALSA